MQGPAIKTNLKRDTKVFITFRDLFCNTDDYVLKFLYNKIKSGKSNITYLDTLVGVYDTVPKEAHGIIPYGKRHYNPLMDFIDYDTIESCDYMSVFDDMYNEVLYNEKSNIFEGLELTNIATALSVLLSDDLLKSFTIQVDKVTDAVYTYIYKRFVRSNPEKVHLVEGHLRDTLTNDYDDYFIPHATFLNNLCIERKFQIDVVIPEFSHNLVLDEENLPALPRRLKLKLSPTEYREKYAMNVLSIKIPV